MTRPQFFLRPHLILFTGATLLFSPLISVAQEFPAIIVQEEVGKYNPLRMDRLDVDIKVVGRLATTTLEMRFVNELHRDLEGELTFPLGEGQTVSRFAMSIGDVLREGVVIEKARGREVFENIVRKEIDPGLLEWTQGNNFRSRVYPIPARGTKTIVIAYEQELPRRKNGLLYSLPLKFGNAVNLSLKAEVIGHTKAPSMKIDELTTLRFEDGQFGFKSSGESGFIAETKIADFQQDAPLAFWLPEQEQPKRVLVEDGYFYLEVMAPTTWQQLKTLPKKLGLLWDISGSAEGRNLEKELAVLAGYLSAIGDLEVQLIPFSNAVGETQTFQVVDGDSEKLLDAIDALFYDGGTQFGAVDLSKFTCDEFLLVSDGLSNFGDHELGVTKTPIQILNSAASADHAYLSYLAQASGGQYLNLQTVETKAAVNLLGTSVFQFLGADFNPQEVEEVYPSLPTPVRDGFFTISGKIVKADAKMTLKFGAGVDVAEVPVVLSSTAPKSGLLSRIWAQKKIAELDMRHEQNSAELTQLGKDFGIVTRNTSLIVLDFIEDYVRYRVEPPQELMAEYREKLQAADEIAASTEKERLQRVVEMFSLRQKWWSQKFKFGHGKRPKDVLAQTAESDRAGAGAVDAFAPARASAPPMRERTAPAANDRSADDPFADLGGSQPMAAPEASADPFAASEEAPSQRAIESDIVLKKWSPDVPYLKLLQAADPEKQLEIYQQQKDDYANSSAFYLDVADFFQEQKQPEVALRVLSNIAEMELENHKLLRILGHRLLQTGHLDLAVSIFREVLKIREEEPQSYRDLGLALAQAGEHQEAVDLMYQVVSGVWAGRFPEIELIAAGEMNAIIAAHGDGLDLGKIDKRLLAHLPVDIRVVLTWDADATDMDLWVIDPNGEKCFYSHRDTLIGAHMSPDFTGGYGPEEFLLKRAQPGKYTVAVNYYGNQQQILAGATTIQVSMITNYGRDSEKVVSRTLRLRDAKDVIEIGEFEFTAP